MKYLYFCQLNGLELVFLANMELQENDIRFRLKNIDPIHENSRCRVRYLLVKDDGLNEPVDISLAPLKFQFWL